VALRRDKVQMRRNKSQARHQKIWIAPDHYSLPPAGKLGHHCDGKSGGFR